MKYEENSFRPFGLEYKVSFLDSFKAQVKKNL